MPIIPQPRSLAIRLGLLAAGGSLVALVIAGLVMATLHKAGAERAFDERLGVFVSQLFADYANDQLFDATVHFPNPAFGLPGSGWFWAVADPQNGVPLFASASLFDPLPPPNKTGASSALSPIQSRPLVMNGQSLRLAERIYSLDGESVLVRVTAPTTGLDLEVQNFRFALLITLGTMWVALLILAYIQVRIGLLPLIALQRAVANVRAAKTHNVEGQFPTEVSPLVEELNGLIASNADIIERARHHVGNLAHALKTPLAVILNTASGPADERAMDRIGEEARSIENRIRVYLDRAQRAALQTATGQASNVKDTVEPLVRTMAKLNLDQGLQFHVSVPGDYRVRADRHDLEEMLGNLLENACRFARTQVSISAEFVPDDTIAIHVDDDGEGLSEDAKKAVLQRGQRLDEAQPGSGLGLSIVQEMVQLYGGSFVLDTSPFNGLRATLNLQGFAPVPPESSRLSAGRPV